ncbi:SRPBCC family protein [Methylobacillus glycogenes]|uniref:SRPBCC family protein n=1 Tax=Methylobacillus glycogenes TaxID=406 RepID=UPI000686382C|nr:SRPBCC family protein [Methylobacillus glycogenes]
MHQIIVDRLESIMPTIEKTIDVNVPVNIAYNQWTQFETFPNFMHSVINVRQLDDTHIWWLAQLGGLAGECEVEIIDQVPDDHIAWRSVSGISNAGVVSFQHVEQHATRVHIEIEFGSGEMPERVTSIIERKLGEDLQRYRELLESRKAPAGGWRGHVSNKTESAVRH